MNEKKVKNIAAVKLGADEVATVKVKYNNKYEYTSFETVEEKGGGTFTYSNITSIAPLTSANLYFLAEMPKVIAEEKDTPVQIEITINNNQYYYDLRK